MTKEQIEQALIRLDELVVEQHALWKRLVAIEQDLSLDDPQLDLIAERERKLFARAASERSRIGGFK